MFSISNTDLSLYISASANGYKWNNKYLPVNGSNIFSEISNADDPVAVYLSDIFTVQANMVGIPAIALPLGTHPNGMPIGIQFMGDSYKEAELLAFANDLLPRIEK